VSGLVLVTGAAGYGPPVAGLVARWRYDWADGHVRGADIIRIRGCKIAETLSHVKG